MIEKQFSEAAICIERLTRSA